MIYLRRSGSGFTVGNDDIPYLAAVADSAFSRGETVELQLDGGPWRPVTPVTFLEVLDELHEEHQARAEAMADVQLRIGEGA